MGVFIIAKHERKTKKTFNLKILYDTVVWRDNQPVQQWPQSAKQEQQHYN